MTFEAYGVGIDVAVDDPDLDPWVEEILPPGRAPCHPSKVTGRFRLEPSGPDSYDVSADGAPWIEHATLDVALGDAGWQIRMFIAANARELIFVLAGVVAQAGKALLIPGESFRQGRTPSPLRSDPRSRCGR